MFAAAILSCTLSFGQGKYQRFEKNTMDGTKIGVINNETNEEVIPAVYDQIGDYSEGRFTVLKDEKVGVVDTLHEIVIPLEYLTITNCVENRFFILNNANKWAMADSDGKFMTEFSYDNILGYQYGVARVVMNNKIGYVDNQGKVILPCQFDEGYDCFGDLILIYGSTWQSLGLDVVKTDIWGNEIDRKSAGISGKMPVLYNKKGQLVYKGEAGETIVFAPDFNVAIVDKYIPEYDGTYNKVITKEGKILIDYDKQYRLKIKSNWIEIKVVGKGWQYGIMNFDGEIILKPNFSEISSYKYDNGNLARVYFPNRAYFYINKKAECVEFEGQQCPE